MITCVAGGPSLLGFDFTRLKGYTIGANRAAVEANTDAMVSIDTNFANKAGPYLEDYNGEVYFATPNKKHEYSGVTYLKRDRGEFLSTDPERLTGLESGYAAINLALIKGATHINLLGYDMNGNQVKRFHEGYNWNMGDKAVSYSQWAKRYRYAKISLDKLGVTVTHYIGPEGSAIDVFPRLPLKDY